MFCSLSHSCNRLLGKENSGLWITLNRHVSLVSFNLKQFPPSSLSFMTLIYFYKYVSQVFCRFALDLNLSYVSLWLDSGYASSGLLLKASYWWCMISVCAITSDSNFMSTKFLHHKVTAFSFIINYLMLMEKCFEMACPYQTFTLVFVSIGESCLNQLFPNYFLVSHFMHLY
jgi:hypothetical protein